MRWLLEPKRLTREQMRVLSIAERRGEPFGVSSITLLEIAVLFGRGGIKLRVPIEEVYTSIREQVAYFIVPMDFEVASEVAAIGNVLTDPADRAIVATARVHRLKLVTSDQNIIDSRLVAVVE